MLSRFISSFLLSVFVRYCSHLRSGVGSKYTAADIADYVAVQRQLNDLMSGVVSLVKQ